jgi:tetratricopeptide (TPR) repeat protein
MPLLFRKGESTQIFKPWKLIPLFLEASEEAEKRQSLPRYSECDHAPPTLPLSLPSSAARFIQTLMANRSHDTFSKYEVIVCLYLVMNDGGCFLCVAENDHSSVDDTSLTLTRKSWELVKEQVDYECWKSLLSHVRQRMMVVSTDHPIVAYASTVVPTLNTSDFQCLTDQLADKHTSASVLAVMKYLQDSVEPRLYAVLPDEPRKCDQERCRHSCLPTGTLELLPSGPAQLSIIALYDQNEQSDGEEKAELSLCLIEDDESVETRETAVQRRTGRSCACTRCCYEVAASLGRAPDLTVDKATHLGRYYLSKGRLEDARALYEYALSRDDDQADLWHALGAIKLSHGKFLEAQRVWEIAAKDHPKTCQQHKGIALQLEKIKCYGYLRDNGATSRGNAVNVSWRSPVPQAYITPGLVSRAICQQIIQWAESGQWTQQRHYAVPTHDVPVHTVSHLLDWFNNFMVDSGRQLLANQFATSTNYFVHDAFCVKYEASGVSNHLPIHTDESTHSFVLALNDDYEGGGTHFYDHNKTARLQTGDLLSFRGDSLYHGGEAVTKGLRYILAVFLYHDDDGLQSPSGGRKRPPNLLSHTVREAKEQKIDFSFGFQLES